MKTKKYLRKSKKKKRNTRFDDKDIDKSYPENEYVKCNPL